MLRRHGSVRRRLTWVVTLLIVLATPLGGWLAWSARGNAEQEVARLADLLKLERGMTVAEIGAGNGKMTVAMAQRLGPNGKVLSTDLNADRVAGIREAVTAAGLENVDVRAGQESVAGLPAGCCDAIFMSKVYHHFTAPETMNRSFLDSLRPGGRIAIIDFEPAGWQIWLRQPEGVPQDRGGHGMPRDVLVRELEAAGFVIEHQISDWWGGPFGRYCVTARLPLS
ncbi:MAG: class I SAM-dependent methyltransferase [Acidobacteria bacterium]|nr:class I SAM-dependent methyltransferase [Acidobacteriota bacterium]